MTIDRPTGETIARLMSHLRPEWDLPGCVAAVRTVARRHPGDVAMAAVRLAMTPEAKTPAVLGVLDGPHWREKVAPTAHRQPPRKHEQCRQHAGEWAESCRGCAADQLAPVVELHPEPMKDWFEVAVAHHDAMAAIRAELARVRMAKTEGDEPA